MNLSHDQKTALAHAYEAALHAFIPTGCPAALSVAQWALESGWGAHQPGNNCFGIKYYVGAPDLQMLDTTEVVHGATIKIRTAFAKFDNLTQCFIKHGYLIAAGRPYAAAFAKYKATGSLIGLIDDIAPIYATDPGYANKLKQVLNMPEVAALFPVRPLHQ